MIKVLVAENDPVVAGALCSLLRRAGFETTWVVDGSAAVSLIGGADVVVTNTCSPDVDGVEVCRLIRERSSVPVVVVSADDPVVAGVRARSAGADAFLAIPFTSRALVQAMHTALDRCAGDGAQLGCEPEVVAARPVCHAPAVLTPRSRA